MHKHITHLLSHGRELEYVERLVIHGRALVNIYDHAGFTSASEITLQIVSEFTLSERNVLSESENK